MISQSSVSEMLFFLSTGVSQPLFGIQGFADPSFLRTVMVWLSCGCNGLTNLRFGR
jgi:hypothetical protein